MLRHHVGGADEHVAEGVAPHRPDRWQGVLGLQATAGNAAVQRWVERPAVVVQRDNTKADAERAMGAKNVEVDLPDGGQLVHDTFSRTYTLVYADGTGVLQQYDEVIGEDGALVGYELVGPPTPLSQLRVKALGYLDDHAGTWQEDDDGTKRRDTDKANLVKATADYEKRKAEGKLKPNEQPPKLLHTTYCNKFLSEYATHLNPEKKGKRAGNAGLGGMMPETEGVKRGSWRTLETNPEGPRPGDLLALSPAGAPKTVAHVGTLRGRRPEADGTREVWTVIDGGQGTYAGRQKVLERTRYYDVASKILTNTADEKPTSDKARMLRGWIDIDAHFAAEDAPSP